MGKFANIVLMCIALGVAYEAGKEDGAREMFFKWTEAMLKVKGEEK